MDSLGHPIKSDVLKVLSEFFFLLFSLQYLLFLIKPNGSRYHLQVFCFCFKVKGDNS